MAILFAAVAWWMTAPFTWSSLLIVAGLSALFFAGSRNTLTKYGQQVEGLLESA